MDNDDSQFETHLFTLEAAGTPTFCSPIHSKMFLSCCYHSVVVPAMRRRTKVDADNPLQIDSSSSRCCFAADVVPSEMDYPEIWQSMISLVNY